MEDAEKSVREWHSMAWHGMAWHGFDEGGEEGKTAKGETKDMTRSRAHNFGTLSVPRGLKMRRIIHTMVYY